MPQKSSDVGQLLQHYQQQLNKSFGLPLHLLSSPTSTYSSLVILEQVRQERYERLAPIYVSYLTFILPRLALHLQASWTRLLNPNEC